MMKVREIKHTNGDRPLILMGWGAGAAIAAHVAGVEKVNGKISNRFIGVVKTRKWLGTHGSWNTTYFLTSKYLAHLRI
jgi:hypothetical protein